MNFPIRGWLNMLSEGNCSVEEAEEVINRIIEQIIENERTSVLSDVRVLASRKSQDESK